MKEKGLSAQPTVLVGGFALLNIVMYVAIQKYWIGGRSFLPMMGDFGVGGKFLFAFVVNLGLIAGAFIGAKTSGEFRLRMPQASLLPRAMLGGILIGMGVTLAPGTCTTAFVTGMPMLSVASFISVAGILIGAYIMFKVAVERSSA